MWPNFNIRPHTHILIELRPLYLDPILPASSAIMFTAYGSHNVC